MYNKSKRVLALILTIALSLFAVSCVRHPQLPSAPLRPLTVRTVQWGVATQGAPAALVEVHGIQGCHWAASMTSSVRIAIAWEALFALDCLFFGLTLARTWQVGVARGRWRARTGDRRLDLVRIMRRDGAMYFGYVRRALMCGARTDGGAVVQGDSAREPVEPGHILSRRGARSPLSVHAIPHVR